MLGLVSMGIFLCEGNTIKETTNNKTNPNKNACLVLTLLNTD